MNDKIKKYIPNIIIFFIFFVFFGTLSISETFATPPPCAYKGCYLELNYPKYLHVSKPGVGPLYKPYLGDGEFLGSAVDKIYADVLAKTNDGIGITNKGLIWYPNEAVGKNVDVIIALHGIRTLSKPGNNEFVYSTDDNFKKFDKIVREYMDKGLSKPVVIIAPMYDKGYHDTVWDNKVAYNTKGLLDATKKAIAAAKLNITIKSVSVLGHNNANCGGGLARTANELEGINLYLYMAADGTCGKTTPKQPVGIGPFFIKYNVFNIVNKKGGYIFHMHESVSDLGAVDEIKSTYKGGKDPETPTNGSQYNETWKSENGTVFSYSLTSASGPYGAHDHTHLPQYMLAEVLPRFFGNKPYDPKANPPILENWTPGTKVSTGNQNPSQNASIINDVFGNKQLTDSELQKFLQKPVPKIKIPGLNFSDITLSNLQSAEDGGYIYFPFLGEYISALYKYLIVIIGIIAVIMLIIAGLQWMLPGGEAENISSAKKRIEQAIVGLIIAVSSYSILFIINPELVNFRSLRVKYVSSPDSPVDATKDAKTRVPCLGKKLPSESAGIGIPHFEPLEDTSCGNRDLKTVKWLVIHEGSKKNTFEFLATKNLSSHFEITQEGKILQGVDIRRRAYHASQINPWSIGVDMNLSAKCKPNGKGETCTWTPEQYEALNQLINILVTKTNIRRDDEHIIGHCQVQHADRNDPRNFDWTKIGLRQEKHRDLISQKCVRDVFTDIVEAKITEEAKLQSKLSTIGCCTIQKPTSEVQALPLTNKECEKRQDSLHWAEEKC